MDKEKAVRWLKAIRNYVITLEEPYRSEALEAIMMAIQALRWQQEQEKEGKKDGKEG